MKRNMKIAALALALAACLLLTGCYTAPDEVNNGGDTGRTANSLPFPTKHTHMHRHRMMHRHMTMHRMRHMRMRMKSDVMILRPMTVRGHIQC